MKVLWIKVATTSLEPEHAQLIELAYRPQIDGEFMSETKHVSLKPVLLDDDKRYLGADPVKLMKWYNTQNRDPRKQLAGFRFSEEDPFLFMYARGSLSAGMPEGKMRDPRDWLAKGRVYPEVALTRLLEEMALHSGDREGHWTLAGHNVEFDASVFRFWCERVLGSDTLLNAVFSDGRNLDTVMLARLLGAFGKISPPYNSFSLVNVAKCLGIALPECPTVKESLEAIITVATNVGELMRKPVTEK